MKLKRLSMLIGGIIISGGILSIVNTSAAYKPDSDEVLDAKFGTPCVFVPFMETLPIDKALQGYSCETLESRLLKANNQTELNTIVAHFKKNAPLAQIKYFAQLKVLPRVKAPYKEQLTSEILNAKSIGAVTKLTTKAMEIRRTTAVKATKTKEINSLKYLTKAKKASYIKKLNASTTLAEAFNAKRLATNAHHKAAPARLKKKKNSATNLLKYRDTAYSDIMKLTNLRTHETNYYIKGVKNAKTTAAVVKVRNNARVRSNANAFEHKVEVELRKKIMALRKTHKFADKKLVMLNSKSDVGLSRMARLRAYEASKLFDHVRPNKLAVGTTVSAEYADFVSGNVGENLHMRSGYSVKSNPKTVANAIYKSWLSSGGHYANMVYYDNEILDVGVYLKGNEIYASMLASSYDHLSTPSRFESLRGLNL